MIMVITRILKFSKCPIEPFKGRSWDKIVARKVDQEFTTFRGYTIKKHHYYYNSIGEGTIFKVLEEGFGIGTARLLKVDTRTVKQLTIEEVTFDTFSLQIFKEHGINEPKSFLRRVTKYLYGLENVALLKLYFNWISIR